ncbi:probable serine hydrolase isoform X2 [Neocloeon triangulifer]|uniref:probable serine hydrolase isoform X2 n=1 Tax=Neocloeon triangulifer TaxID=2078957 RepID=UPI00286F66AA|nr:probable serine hydrolase isoform X2 [Neocloeon triangulifer]
MIQRCLSANGLRTWRQLKSVRTLQKIQYRQLSQVGSSQEQPERKWEEVRIPVPWGHIAGKKWGEPEEIPVIAIHGWRDNAGTFDTLAPLLKFNFLSIDLPGHGLSSHVPIGMHAHYPDSMVTLRLIVKHFGFSKISILGHSLGSSIGYAYAGLYPEEVEKFVSIECGRARILCHPKDLADSWGATVDSLLSLEEKLVHQKSPEYTYSELVERQQKGAFMSPSIKSTQILLRRGAQPSKCDPDKFVFTFDPRVRLDSFKRFTPETLLALGRNIKCQVLNIHANPGMSCKLEKEYEESIEVLKTSTSRLECHEVSGTHHVHLNNPERVAPIINDFMLS